MASPLVTGHILFDDPAGFSGATVRVLLEEISRADAPATVIAQQITRDVRYQTGAPLSFRLDPGSLPPRGQYIVRVHVDVDNSGDISSGDYISTATVPVVTFPATVQVHVRKVP